MDSKIYVVSVFTNMDVKESSFSEKGEPYIGSKVITGWYSNKEKAESVIVNNVADIWETCYHYAALEECNEGMYDYGREITYYKYNRDTKKYDILEDVPDAFKGIAFSVSGIGM